MKQNFKPIFLTLSISLLILELIRVVFLLWTQRFNIHYDMSIQLCFLYPIICILAFITKKQYFYDYIACSSILFGVGAIIIFSYHGTFFQFDIIHNYVYHSMIIWMGLLFQKSGYTIQCQNIIPVLLIFFLQLLLAKIVNIILGPPTNYMFLATIFEPENNIYHTQTLTYFYTPILLKYSIAHYLTQLKIYLGSLNYHLLIITIMINNYLFSLLPFQHSNHNPVQKKE